MSPICNELRREFSAEIIYLFILPLFPTQKAGTILNKGNRSERHNKEQETY
jgi:hypothetical protein